MFSYFVAQLLFKVFIAVNDSVFSLYITDKGFFLVFYFIHPVSKLRLNVLPAHRSSGE